MDILKEVKNLNLPLGEYIVVGSGPMAARGIRDCKDIDILVSEKLFDLLKNKGWNAVNLEWEGRKFTTLKKGIFEVDKNFCTGNFSPDTDEIIKSAEIIDGVPFQPLTELIKFKKALGREKDSKDIELIKKYLDDFKKFTSRLAYRKNVGALVKKGNKYLLISYAWQADSYWKMPQGGVHDGETKKQALMRELQEELGTDKFEIIKQFPYSHRYDWEEESVRAPGNKFRGQKQTFFLVDFLGTDEDIKIDTKELKAYGWFTKDELLKKVDIKHSMFKGYKKLAEKLLK